MPLAKVANQRHEGSRAAALAARDADRDRQVQGRGRHGPDPGDGDPHRQRRLSAGSRDARRGRHGRQRRVGAQAQVPAPDPDRSADELDRVGPARLSGPAGLVRLGRTERLRRLHEGGRHRARRHEVPGLVRRRLLAKERGAWTAS